MPTYQKPIIQHSLYGRAFGLTPDGGVSGGDQTIATHSTAAADLNLDRTRTAALSSNAATFALPAPGPNFIGVQKTIYSGNTTSTLVRTISCTGCNFLTSGGSSFVSATLAGPGQWLNALAVSSALWMVAGTNSSSVLTT